jgi:Mn2+/Fe2+ NRAMP family transporter
MLKRLRYHILIFFSVIGPGFITAMVDNDAGGIYTYSQAGAKYGYLPLWTLIPITILLVVTQEMCSRMGAVTGKGLSDLIREEFGLRTTFLILAALVVTNFANVVANFAGVASSLELFHVSRYISVPIAAIVVWLLVVKGTYQSVERVFLFACVIFICYIISGVLVKPDWKEAAIYSVRPVLMLDPGYITMIIGMVGTSIAPWMQFYLQAAVVEKGSRPRSTPKSRIEVIVGCIAMSVIAFFIIVACAGAIWSVAPRDIEDATDAALGLRPFGHYAYLLFCAGLLNASLFAACIQPLSTAYNRLRGIGLRERREPPLRGSPHLLLALHAAGGPGRGAGAAAATASGESDPVFAGHQRRAPAVHIDLHDPAGEQGRNHEGVAQLADIQPGGLDIGGDPDRPHAGASWRYVTGSRGPLI